MNYIEQMLCDNNLDITEEFMITNIPAEEFYIDDRFMLRKTGDTRLIQYDTVLLGLLSGKLDIIYPLSL
jgi:hypothetical protein